MKGSETSQRGLPSDRGPDGDDFCVEADATGDGQSSGATRWLQLGIVSVANFVVWSGFGAILPVLPIFLQEQAHASEWLIGVVAAAYYLGALLFSAPLGRLSDSVGRKPLIVAGVALYSVSTFLFLSTTRPGWFVVFRFLEGVGVAAVSPAGRALVAELSTDATRSRAYGWLTTAQFGGLVVGPALGGQLYNLGGGQGIWAFYAIFVFGGVISAVTAAALFFAVKEPEDAVRRREVKIPHPPYRELVTKPVMAFLVVAITGHFAMGVFEVLWSLWLRHLGASVTYIGLTWVAFGAPMLLAFVGGYLADRYNRWALMFSGYAISGVAWILYGTTTNLVLFLAVNAIEGLAIAWSYPAKQAFLVQVVPPRWLGSIQGLESTAMQISALVGTIVAPLLFKYLHGYVISMAGVVTLLGLAWAAPVLGRAWKEVRRSGSPSVTSAERRG
jgi:MFS family permease